MPVSEKKRITNDRYTEKCDRINFFVTKSAGSAIRTAAEASGTSIQGYVFRAIREQMKSDGLEVSDRLKEY